MRSERMIKYLPVYERSSKIFQSLIDTEAQEIDDKAFDIDEFIKQLSIDTATWGLTIYEQELEIKTDIDKSYEERRSTIKSKLRGTGKVDKDLIKLVSYAHANGDVEVTFDGRIQIRFISTHGVPTNIEDLKRSLEEIKPAHLGFDFKFTYNPLWYLEEYHIGWLDAFTYEELRSMKIPTEEEGITHERMSNFSHEKLEVIFYEHSDD